MTSAFHCYAFLALSAAANGFSISLGRRHFIAVAPAAVLVAAPPGALAAPNEAELTTSLLKAKSELVELPKLVGDMQWDQVRAVLRQPAVNALWNTVDSGNTLLKLAKRRDEPEIIEAAEDVARNLRDVDQIVYSNSFSMEGKMAGAGLRTTGDGVGGKAQGGGGGQYRIKEPQDLLRAAIVSIDGVIAAAASN